MGMVKIALADDDVDLRTSLHMLLELHGFQVVISVGNGADLLASLPGVPVDVILTDFHMDQGGLPLLERLQALHQDIPVYVLSGEFRGTREVEAVGVKRLYQKGDFGPGQIREIYSVLLESR